MTKSETFAPPIPDKWKLFKLDILKAFHLLMLGSLLGAIGALLHQRAPTPANLPHIDVRELLPMAKNPERHPNIVILDTRTPEVYLQAHIPGALNLPSETFDTTYPLLKPQLHRKKLITYCASSACPSAQNVSEKLIAKNHTVQIYKEGWEEWTIMQNPVTTNIPPPHTNTLKTKP
jgi:rhodanese-related sulfurtransferase